MEAKQHRRPVIVSEAEAAGWIRDGITIAIGGLANSSHPMTIVRQIIRRGLKNLTVVGAAVSGLDVDLLVGAGCVRKVISPYVGAEALAPIGPFFRAAAERGDIEVWECDEGQYYAGLRAAAQMLPFMPCRGGVGTSYPKVNPDLKVFQDPIKGEMLLAVPAIEPDLAILHAAYADPYGNVQHVGTGYADRVLWRAADRTIVQVEKIISNEEVRRDPLRTSILDADAILRAPYGAHPFSSPGFYIEDRQHIRELVEAANAYLKRGDRGHFEAYLNKYIYEPDTHADYLERIGIKRLLSLYEY